MLYKYTQKGDVKGVVERWFKIAFMSTECLVIRDERDNFQQHIFFFAFFLGIF